MPRLLAQPLAFSTTLLALGLLTGACRPGARHGGDAVGLSQHHSRPRIIGGERFEGLPAVGALTYDGQPFCTGTLVAPRLVLTAAHCIEDGAPWLLRFALGPSAWRPEAEVGVLAVEPHPAYDPDDLSADLGFVHLASAAPAEPLAPVAFIDSSWLGVELMFVGYGMELGGDHSGVGFKRQVRMPVERLTPTHLAFGGYAANICDGDSGSPALLESWDGTVAVAGVVSSGDTWCEEYGLATRLDAYPGFVFGAEDLDDPLAESPGCGDETYYGRCEDEILVWCEDGKVMRRDCPAIGASCGLYSEEEGYFCLQ